MITTIPFRIITIDKGSYHLLIKVYINRKVANLIIDTGASKTVFDKNRIEKYVVNKKFDLNDKLSIGLGTSSMESHFTVLKKIKIGAMEIKDYDAILLDLSNVNESYANIGLAPIDGVLGSDILLKNMAIINYEKKTLRLKYSK